MRSVRLWGLALAASVLGAGVAFAAGQEASTEDTAPAAAATTMGGTEIVLIGGVYTWPKSWLEAPTAAELNITSFNEAPMLAQMVDAGELPPLAERLPEDPLVFEPYEEVGTYGGTLRVARLSPGDWGDMHRGHKVFPYRADPSTSEAIPMLFKDFDASADGSQWTFHLRPGVKWSDGMPFTTADIMFAYEYIFKDSEIPHGTRNRFTVGGQLADFQAIDDYTLRVSFAGPVSKLITMQMLNWTRIKQGDLFVPAHYMKDFSLRTNDNAEALAKEHGYENWIGHFMARRDMSPKQPFVMPELSAWTLESRDAIGIYMVRNPYFWAVDTAGNQLPYIDRIEARYFSDKQVAILSMMQGKIDIGGRMMNPDEFPLYVQNQEEGDYRVLQWQDTKMTRVGYQFNLMHPEPVKRQVFSDIRFRRAMSVAIDRNAVNEFAFQGLATPTQMTIDPGASFFDPAWAQKYAQYDPDQAMAWLDEVGLKDADGDGTREGPDGNPFVIDLLISSESVLGTMGFTVSEIVAENWRDVGLQVNLRQISQELFEARSLAGEVDVAVFPSDSDLETRVTFRVMFDNERYHGYAIPWEQWIRHQEWERGGRQGPEPPAGERPPDDVVQLVENWWDWVGSTDEETYQRLGVEVWEFLSEYLGMIGTVGKAVRPILINNRIRNVPETLPFSFETYLWVPTTPSQWFIRE